MRKLAGMVMLLLLSVVLVSCSVGQEDTPKATEAPTPLPVSTRISETEEDTDVGIPGTPAFDIAGASTPDIATPAVAATPAETLMATPEGAAMPPMTPVASPAMAIATPATMASPVASPVMLATPEGTAVEEPAGMIVPPAAGPTEPPVMIEMTGVVTLDGRPNETYVLTDEGCVAIGAYSQLHAGRQVVIRNEQGTITSVTELEPATDTEGCAWEFVAAVPESEFYSVSIPMVVEQVFPAAQVAENDGAVVIELP